MPITTFTTGNILTVEIEGRCDFDMYQEFRQAADKITTSTIGINFDFEKANYLDSSALGMLLMLKEKINGGKQNTSIINANPTVKKILDVSNFGQLFKIT